MRRRRRQSSFATPVFWLCALAAIAWGFYQARQIWSEVGKGPTPAANIQNDASPAPSAANPQLPTPARYTLEGLNLDMGMLPGDDEDTTAVLPEPLPDPNLIFDPALTTDDLRAMGTRLLQSGEVIRARYAFNAALARVRDESAGQALRDTLKNMNVPIFMGNATLPEDPGARLVDIEPGDSFVKVAHEFAVTAAFLQTINPALNPKHLKPQTGMKVVQGPFNIRIIKHAARADLYAREMYVRSYPVEFPEGNILPSGDYRIARDGKIDFNTKRWMQFEGVESSTEAITSGWIFGTAGPRGTSTKDRAAGLRLADPDLAMLYTMMVEQRSRLRVEP